MMGAKNRLLRMLYKVSGPKSFIRHACYKQISICKEKPLIFIFGLPSPHHHISVFSCNYFTYGKIKEDVNTFRRRTPYNIY